MIDSPKLAAVQGSWRTARQDNRAFAERFYNHLFEMQPELRAMFPDEMTEQRRQFVDMLNSLVSGLANPSVLIMDLTPLAHRHAAYGARPEHYTVVGEALIAALRDQLGEEFTPDTQAAWAEVYEIIATVMIDAQLAIQRPPTEPS